jgi:ribosomal protein S17E
MVLHSSTRLINDFETNRSRLLITSAIGNKYVFDKIADYFTKGTETYLMIHREAKTVARI